VSDGRDPEAPEDEGPRTDTVPAPPRDSFELFREPGEEDVDRDLPGETRDALPAQVSRPTPITAARGPRCVVVAGAKGGVGTSMIAANLGVYLATIGRRAVTVDGDPKGASLHSFLGVPHPSGVLPYEPPRPSFRRLDPIDPKENRRPIEEDDEPAPPPSYESEIPPEDEDTEVGLLPLPGDAPVEVPIPGLKIMHGATDEPARGRRRRARRKHLLGRVRALDADYAVLDLGTGLVNTLFDAWLDADLGLFVTSPQRTAIEGMYRFVRAAFARYLVRRVGEKGSEARREIRAILRESGRHAPPPLDVARALEARGDERAQLVREAMEEFRFRFVVNQTRLRSDLELGGWIESAARRRLGLRLEYLGYVDDDDAVPHCLRVGRPLLVESPGTKASRNIEKIARRLLAIDAGKGRRTSLPLVPPDSHHDLLEVDRGATDEEIRRAYKRSREVYARGSVCCYGLFDERGLELLRGRLEEAHDVLLDPARRRPYELSVFPPEPAKTAAVDEAEEGPKPPPPVITPETDFTGGLLRAVRRSQGIRVQDISARTKIGVAFLRAIEDDDFPSLPALVYVRGFVTEIAKCLHLDPEHVARTYVRRYRRHLEEQRAR